VDGEPDWSLWEGAARRYAEVDAAMRALLVVVAEVLPQDGFKVASPEHQGPVEALDASRPHGPLSGRVPRGERTGALMISAPSDLKTSSKLTVNFVSRSRIRNLT
jgi:hypothetical protein